METENKYASTAWQKIQDRRSTVAKAKVPVGDTWRDGDKKSVRITDL